MCRTGHCNRPPTAVGHIREIPPLSDAATTAGHRQTSITCVQSTSRSDSAVRAKRVGKNISASFWILYNHYYRHLKENDPKIGLTVPMRLAGKLHPLIHGRVISGCDLSPCDYFVES